MCDNGDKSLEFLGMVRRQLPYLFDLYGFEPELRIDDRNAEFRLVVLRSDQCKIRFYMWQDVPEISLGTLNAPARESTSNNSGTADWQDVNLVLGFLKRLHPELRPEIIKQKSGSTAEETLAWYSARLRPYCDLAFAAFAHAASPDWWQAYNAFKQS